MAPGIWSQAFAGLQKEENGNYYSMLGLYWGNIGIMEKKMETIIVYWGCIGVACSEIASLALNLYHLIRRPGWKQTQ